VDFVTRGSGQGTGVAQRRRRAGAQR